MARKPALRSYDEGVWPPHIQHILVVEVGTRVRFNFGRRYGGYRSSIDAALFAPPVQWSEDGHTRLSGRAFILVAYQPPHQSFRPALRRAPYFVALPSNPHNDRPQFFSVGMQGAGEICLGPILLANAFAPGETLMVVGAAAPLTKDMVEVCCKR